MARKRSRPNTESEFRNAVVDLIGQRGFDGLGINLIAQKAGSDKVLIYRYFGDYEGLLQSVAESRTWLPSRDSILQALHGISEGPELLRRLALFIVREIRKEAVACKLFCWRHAVDNPMTRTLNRSWHELIQTITHLFADGQDYDSRKRWEQACQVAALWVEAEVCGRSMDTALLEAAGAGLNTEIIPAGVEPSGNDSLPTNLL
ncbi:TetR/AcrR family transcriptional regulator [Coraliomargarita parva]|uniref:TetR/AcrR family transcriptional regulator n=1 Tax=Coraliomargarita parva TaxID=3014050 RepID=UPI0022B3F4F8|nr:TetR/AcrR family transcriptional regulator [Coraliomargarita parva]